MLSRQGDGKHDLEMMTMHPIYDRVEDRAEVYEREIRPDQSYTARELRFLLECYAPDRQLKAPFITSVAPTLVPALTEAVRYFTNTALIIRGTDHNNHRVIVESIGQS